MARRPSPSHALIKTEYSPGDRTSVILFTPPKLNGACTDLGEDIVEDFLLFEGRRETGIGQGGFELPHNIANISHVFSAPFSEYYVACTALYIAKTGEVPSS
jgi:hypothetical protein